MHTVCDCCQAAAVEIGTQIHQINDELHMCDDCIAEASKAVRPVPTASPNYESDEFWYSARTEIEKCEAEFDLLTRQQQLKYFKDHAHLLGSVAEQKLNEHLIDHPRLDMAPLLFERLRKMHMYHTTPDVIRRYRINKRGQ